MSIGGCRPCARKPTRGTPIRIRSAGAALERPIPDRPRSQVQNHQRPWRARKRRGPHCRCQLERGEIRRSGPAGAGQEGGTRHQLARSTRRKMRAEAGCQRQDRALQRKPGSRRHREIRVSHPRRRPTAPRGRLAGQSGKSLPGCSVPGFPPGSGTIFPSQGLVLAKTMLTLRDRPWPSSRTNRWCQPRMPKDDGCAERLWVLEDMLPQTGGSAGRAWWRALRAYCFQQQRMAGRIGCPRAMVKDLKRW